MPNRIIKESHCTSEKISSLSDFEFRLWVGLITQADDAGRGDARPAIIKGRVFPLRERVATKDIDAAIHGLADKGCVSLYTVGGKRYFCFPTWGEHQRIRESKPKYPGPDESDILPRTAADCGGLPPESNPIHSDSESDSKSRETRARRFTPPSLEEVSAYVQERNSDVDPQGFIDFYASKGWMVGKTPMKDWKAACRNAENWERWKNKESYPKAKCVQTNQQTGAPTGPTMAEIERMKKMLQSMGGDGGD